MTLGGERAAVVLSAADHDALRVDRPGLVDDLLAGHAWDDDLADALVTRAKTPSRAAALSWTSSRPTSLKPRAVRNRLWLG